MFNLVQQNELALMEGPRSYSLVANLLSTAPADAQTTVTVSITDKDGNVTSTSFVIQTVANSNVVPTFSVEETSYEKQVLPATTAVHSFTVDGAPSKEDLRISAVSSNTNLVPNDATHLLCSSPAPGTGTGTVTITPVAPTPSPSPGVSQSATITLTVQDDRYTRQKTFLYVLEPPVGGVASSFARPSGVYNFDVDDQTESRQYNFLNGEMHGFSWANLETAAPDTMDHFNWAKVDDAVNDLPNGQDISINLQQEPCYIATTTGVVTWCDTDTTRSRMHSMANATP